MSKSYTTIPVKTVKDRCIFLIAKYTDMIVTEENRLIKEVMERKFFPYKTKESARKHFTEYRRVGYGFNSGYLLNLKTNRRECKEMLNMCERTTIGEQYIYLTVDDVTFLWPIG